MHMSVPVQIAPAALLSRHPRCLPAQATSVYAGVRLPMPLEQLATVVGGEELGTRALYCRYWPRCCEAESQRGQKQDPRHGKWHCASKVGRSRAWTLGPLGLQGCSLRRPHTWGSMGFCCGQASVLLSTYICRICGSVPAGARTQSEDRGPWPRSTWAACKGLLLNIFSVIITCLLHHRRSFAAGLPSSPTSLPPSQRHAAWFTLTAGPTSASSAQQLAADARALVD